MSSESIAPPVRVVVVDDEAHARGLIREYLSGMPGFELVAECSNGFEAVKVISRERPDLVLLDIQMPKLDGFEVLELLEPKPAVIFVTAFDEYAVKAFEVHAIDYLLKPFGRERLAEVLEHAVTRLRPGGSDVDEASPALMRPRSLPLDRILVRNDSDVVIIPAAKLDYAEAQDDYVKLTVGEASYLKQQTLSELEEQLDGRRFIRVHRSYIINLDRLAKVELYAKDSRVAILRDGTKVPISRTGYAKLRERL
jgi:two-component system, LytTR family, response regulator